VWPENALGFAVPGNEASFAGALDGLDSQSRLLVGAPRAVQQPGGRVEFRNAAFLLTPAGHVAAYYDKLRLTPFAEYAPWPASALARRRHARSDLYTPGEAWTLFEVAGHRFATLICYEAIYADLVRRFVGAGAEFLVNISNDDWFGARPAVMQHFHAALLSAVAHRRPLVRVTNTGVTAVVAPTGAVVARAPVGTAASLVATVAPIRATAVYTRYGDAFAWLCVGLAGLALIIARRSAEELG
jgi:apolipoprotein N-acyltransferase